MAARHRVQWRGESGGSTVRVTIIDLVIEGPATDSFSRVMNANMASIMPQMVAAWCEELGHQVHYECYTGFENLSDMLNDGADIVFISGFTRSALTAYAMSNLYRKRGAVTVLGGPHARCYPEDAAKYFDYVLGFTDRTVIEDVLKDCAPHRPEGLMISAAKQPTSLPSLESRWKFVAANMAKAPLLKIVPMIASTGCPYTCAFCIDSTVDYQQLSFGQMEEDLRFLVKNAPGVKVGWHDPNFGIRFNDYLSVIERAVPPKKLKHLAESSLALLSEPNLKRLKNVGFEAILPGVESWYDFGNKSKARAASGEAKVKQVAEHINTILRYIPFVQTNFVLGLDLDEGAEPFELTKKFIDLVPGAYPAFSMFTSYGRAAPMNLGLQRAGRVLPFPFLFLDSTRSMNVKPLHYTWEDFYEKNTDLVRHAWKGKAVWKRFLANNHLTTRFLNVIRAISSNRVRHQTQVSALLKSDVSMKRYYAGESTVLPAFYQAKIESSLGSLYTALPEDAVEHDPYAYMHSEPAVAVAAAE